MSKLKYQVLARKYRPQIFKDVVGQEAIVTTLKNALKFDKVAHAYLFCGSRGVGKTTLARLFAKALNCQARNSDLEPCNECASCREIGTSQSLDVIEIDGASNRGIDDIRQINETISYAPSQGRFKIYIIDEVHMLTKEAFNALLKTLEEPPEKVKFFFATTEPHKVLPTIISRCQRFELGRIPTSQMIAKLEEIASDLDRKVESGALHLIASFSDGSLRDAESLFDQILCFAEGEITTEEIRKALGLVSQDHFFLLDQAFSNCQTIYAFDLVSSLFSSGKDLSHFYTQLIEHTRFLTIAKTIGEKGLELPLDLAAKYLESSRLYTTAQCLYLLDYLLKAESQIQKSSCPRVSLEAVLLHYIQSKNRIPIEVIARKLTELEEKIKNKAAEKPSDQNSEKTNSPSLDPLLPPKKDLHSPEILISELKATSSSRVEDPTTIALKPIEETFKNSNPPLSSLEKPSIQAPVDSAIQNKDLPSIPIEIKINPFFAESPNVKTPEPISPPPITPFKTELPSPIVQNLEIKPAPLKTKPATNNMELPHHPSHYDTLIRFAAVELEGTVKKS